MTHLKSTLAKLSATVAILGAAACSNSQTTQASSPSGAHPRPGYTAYGPALGEGAGYAAGQATMATPGTVGKMPPPPPSSVETTPYVPPLTPAQTAAMTGAAGSTSGNAVANAPVTWGSGEPAEPMGVTNPMGGMDVSGLSDAQLAAVVQTLNQGEIQEAQLAMNRAMGADVKRFAHDMLFAHRDMQMKTTALLTKLQIKPSDNAVSNQLKSDTLSEIATLQTMHGKDFDRDYVDSQVRNHNQALELIDHMLPTVKSSELKAALMNDRAKIEGHLRDAERVQASLQRGNASSQPSGSP
jgi:putative membrane protein